MISANELNELKRMRSSLARTPRNGFIRFNSLNSLAQSAAAIVGRLAR
jgi:hypothetical protein